MRTPTGIGTGASNPQAPKAPAKRGPCCYLRINIWRGVGVPTESEGSCSKGSVGARGVGSQRRVQTVFWVPFEIWNLQGASTHPL